MTRYTRIVSLCRDGVIIAAIGLLLLIVLEVIVRVVSPQTTETLYMNDKSLALADSVLGHVYRPNAHATEKGPEFAVEYKINANGLRDETLHFTPKPSGSTRILLLGDSFTFGAGNDYEKIWPVIFERNLRKASFDVDVVKAGVAAYDTRTEVLYLERLFPQYQPDIVVITFLANDFFTNRPVENERSGSGDRIDIAIRGRDDKGSPSHLAVLAKRLLMMNDWLYSKLYISTERKEFYALPMSEKLRQQMEVTQKLLLRAKQYCLARGVDMVLLSIPQFFQVIVKSKNYKSNDVDVNLLDRLFSDFAAEQGIYFISPFAELSEKYRSDGNDLYFRFDGHLNNAGNDCVGDYFSTAFIQTFKNRLPTRNGSAASNVFNKLNITKEN